MTSRQAVTIPVKPWFIDHHFNGQTILPAVETMLILAQSVKEHLPQCNVQVMEEANFRKFFTIPENTRELSAFVEYEQTGQDAIRARLLSRVLLKKMSRMHVHAELTFINTPPGKTPQIEDMRDSAGKTVTAEQIYRELVPFGESYRSLKGKLHLTKGQAVGTLQPPELPPTHQVHTFLGSPFSLDGAMHAACVLGQCSLDFVPFPTGFQHRTVYSPTVPGKTCNIIVQIVSRTADELICDLSISDEDRTVYEQIKGLQMRDVSGGRIRPPRWIQSLLT